MFNIEYPTQDLKGVREGLNICVSDGNFSLTTRTVPVCVGVENSRTECSRPNSLCAAQAVASRSRSKKVSSDSVRNAKRNSLVSGAGGASLTDRNGERYWYCLL